MNALQTDTVIEFDYNGRWNAQTMHRKVHPYQLVMDGGKFGAFPTIPAITTKSSSTKMRVRW